MECKRLEENLKGKECTDISLGDELRKHIEKCPECKSFYLLVNVLHSQKGAIEEAPKTILSNVQQRIRDLQRVPGKPAWLDIFRLTLKPALAFSVLLAAVVLYIHFTSSYIGVVDNLVDRFNISKFRYIKTGDMLYAGDSIGVDLKMNNNAKLEMAEKTLLQFKAKDKISLSKGQFFLETGKNGIKIETQNGLIVVKNTKVKIGTFLVKENGSSVTKTSCFVFDGFAEVWNSTGKMTAKTGQELVFAENGRIETREIFLDTTTNDQTIAMAAPVKKKLFAAIAPLCVCVYDEKFDLMTNKQLHNKNMIENKFPVKVFWKSPNLSIIIYSKNDIK